MDTTKPPQNPDKVSQALAHAFRLDEQLRDFIERIKASTPDGRPPFAILASPTFLSGIVTALAFLHANRLVSRVDTAVTEQDINALFDEHGSKPGVSPRFLVRRPAMVAELYGVTFIGAVGIPDGALAFIPQAETAEVVLCDQPVGRPAPEVVARSSDGKVVVVDEGDAVVVASGEAATRIDPDGTPAA